MLCRRSFSCGLSSCAAVAEAMATVLPSTTAATVSIGVVEVAPKGVSAHMVIESADVSLYAAKGLGGDRVIVQARPERPRHMVADSQGRSPTSERLVVGVRQADRSAGR